MSLKSRKDCIGKLSGFGLHFEKRTFLAVSDMVFSNVAYRGPIWILSCNTGQYYEVRAVAEQGNYSVRLGENGL